MTDGFDRALTVGLFIMVPLVLYACTTGALDRGREEQCLERVDPKMVGVCK